MEEKAIESRSSRIRLPVPDTLSFVFLSVWGIGALLGSLVSLMRTPRAALDLCGGALFLTLGIAALGIAGYWLLRIPSITVDRKAQTMSIRPLGPVLKADKLHQIDVWREKATSRRSIQIGCRYRWQVCLVFVSGQEVRVWEGCSQHRARWLAQKLSEATRKPWIGGREARPN
jgi:hypothetical protein